MKKPLFFRLFFAFTALMIALAGEVWAQDAVTASNTALADVRRLEQALAESESAFGPFDTRLLAPLLRLEQALASQGDHERVLDIQNRRLQINRTVLGLENPAVVPVLEEIIDSQVRLGQYDAVTDSLSHQHAIQVANFGAESEAALAILGRQADWYLVRVAMDNDRYPANNFLDARDLADEVLDIAEARFGESSPALIPWLYRRAFNLYQLVDLLNTDSGLGGATIKELIQRDGTARLTTFSRPGLDPISLFGPGSRIPVVEKGERIGVAYLRQALGFIDDIIDIAEQQQDKELLALATLYHGDYQLLMDRGTARRDYRDARQLLVEAGLDSERVDAFLATPMVIPHERFFDRFDAIEAYQREVQDQGEPTSDTESYVGVFTAWHEDIPATPRPAAMDTLPAEVLDVNEAEVQFRLSSRGRVSSVDVLLSDPDERRVRGEARRAVGDIHFRPAFIDGRTRTARDLLLIYRYTPED